MLDITALDANDFEHLIGQAFRASPPAGAPGDGFPLILVSVERRSAAAAFRSPFTLELLGPPSPVHPQGNYRLAHPELGELDLFLVPVSASADGVMYEVVFG